MRQLVYTMFIRNDLASFHLQWKENLVKHQRASNYYENDWRYFVYSTYRYSIYTYTWQWWLSYLTFGKVECFCWLLLLFLLIVSFADHYFLVVFVEYYIIIKKDLFEPVLFNFVFSPVCDSPRIWIEIMKFSKYPFCSNLSILYH